MEETKTLSASKSSRDPKLEVMLYLLAKKPSKKSDQAAAENKKKEVKKYSNENKIITGRKAIILNAERRLGIMESL